MLINIDPFWESSELRAGAAGSLATHGQLEEPDRELRLLHGSSTLLVRRPAIRSTR